MLHMIGCKYHLMKLEFDTPSSSLFLARRECGLQRVGITTTASDKVGDIWSCSVGQAYNSDDEISYVPCVPEMGEQRRRSVLLRGNTEEIYYVPTNILREWNHCTHYGDPKGIYSNEMSAVIYDVVMHVFKEEVLAWRSS